MSQAADDTRALAVDIVGAVLLGLFTSLAAFAAYQASLWGGNQATAYTSAINLLGEANRELLRGVQDQAFDTTVWIEQMKASDAEQKAEEAAEDTEGAEGDDDGHDKHDKHDEHAAPSKEERAQELAAELAYAEDEAVARKLSKVLQSRRELVAAVKWSEEQHEKRTRLLAPQKRLELARTLVALFEQSDALDQEYEVVLAELGLADAGEDEYALLLAQDPAGKERLDKLERDSLAAQAAIEGEMDKLAAPMFFESPTYTRNRESKYLTLLERGNQTFLDGQRFNANGDRFALTTVFFAVALFFAGLGAVIRRMSIKLAFLGASTFVAAGALWYMLNTPFA
jgi:hypothetical protein